jgi:hypothetical protein
MVSLRKYFLHGAFGSCLTEYAIDSFASEVLLNKAGIVYDLTDIKNSKNITLQNDAVIYRSHYNPEVAVVLSVNKPFNEHLSIKLPIPVKQVQMKLPVVNIKSVGTVDMCSAA